MPAVRLGEPKERPGEPIALRSCPKRPGEARPGEESADERIRGTADPTSERPGLPNRLGSAVCPRAGDARPGDDIAIDSRTERRGESPPRAGEAPRPGDACR